MESGVAPAPKRGVCAIRKMLDAEGRGEKGWSIRANDPSRLGRLRGARSKSHRDGNTYIYTYPRIESLRDVNVYFVNNISCWKLIQNFERLSNYYQKCLNDIYDISCYSVVSYNNWNSSSKKFIDLCSQGNITFPCL